MIFLMPMNGGSGIFAAPCIDKTAKKQYNNRCNTVKPQKSPRPAQTGHICR